MTQWHHKFLDALQKGQVYPSLSRAEPQADLDDAYAIQVAFVGAQNATISGYKAALTAPPAQQAMGVEQPIVGTLFAHGEFDTQAPISPERAVLLETELGFTTQTAIQAPINVSDIERCFDQVMPMIELASPNLDGPPSGIDLVATNAASYGYLIGTPVPLTSIDIDAQHVTLRHVQNTVFKGVSGDVLGGQAAALTWLVNRILGLGLPIPAGSLFMTGSIGGIAPGKSGAYEAQFSDLENIGFTLA